MSNTLIFIFGMLIGAVVELNILIFIAVYTRSRKDEQNHNN